ncbi:MAG: hypothetical protein ACRCYS_18860 [Beijerinckiaceae bacterium]
MSSGCGDVLSPEDLKTAKKHQTFETEVITGRAGGVASGAEIDFAANQVTGQSQKTLPAILRDMGFDPASFDFTTGGTVNARDTVVFNPADNNWYSWGGVLPHVVAAGTDPTADTNWKPRTDQLLRQELATVGATTGSAMVANPQGGKVSDAIFYITPGMFGLKADYNPTTDTGTDNTLPLRTAIAVAITLGYQEVRLPAGRILYTDEINLGGVGYRGPRGVVLTGSGVQNTILHFRPAAINSVGISNRGGSGVTGSKAIRNMTLVTTNATTEMGILYLLDSCCFSYNRDLYIVNGAANVKFLNSTATGQFTEFNTFTNCRFHNGLDNILFEVDGGDNSFHGCSFDMVQVQVKSGTTFGNGIRCNGVTGQVFVYNAVWNIHFFGGTNCRAIKLTRANFDNITGNLTHEGTLICETTDNSRMEFKGNFSGIGSLTFVIGTAPTVQSSSFVFRNFMNDTSNFTFAGSPINTLSPRTQIVDLADQMDNGMPAVVMRARNAAGQDALMFNAMANSSGWYFTTTAVNEKIQAANPRYNLRADGGAMSFGAGTARIRPVDATYGLQISGETTKTVAPETDNVMSCGSAAFRWSQVYAASATISTSDEDLKVFRDTPDSIASSEKRAAAAIKAAIKAYQFTDAIAEKQGNARFHFGVGAQTVYNILADSGLNPDDYAFLTLEQWPDVFNEDGDLVKEAGSLWGVRYEELMMFILMNV